MIIDAHQHFWRYTDDEFGWIASDALRRDFLPPDLKRAMDVAKVDQALAIEARQTMEETDQLLLFAERNPFIIGVTGWLPIVAPDFERTLQRYLAYPKLKALRHVVQDEPDDKFILREDFNRGIAALEKTSLAYEILVFQRQLKSAIRFADLHPNLRLVLDHLGKPERTADGAPHATWTRLVREMSRRENVWCKVSGLVTEVGNVDFRPYLEIVLDAFGPKRVMWGSDWPVCTADLAYDAWLAACREVLPDECFGCVARNFYQL